MQWAVLAFASPYLLPLSAAATPSMSLLRSNTCTSSSSARIGAKYCLNSGFASRVDKLSLCPFSLACSLHSLQAVADPGLKRGSFSLATKGLCA